MTRYLIFTLAVIALMTPALASAQRSMAESGDRDPGWYFEAELSGLMTAGNSESSTWGLSSTLERLWTKSLLKFEVGGTQTESSLITRTATGTEEEFEIREDKVTEKTAELFFARGRYGHLLSKKIYGFGGIDWLRNTFAGIDSRFLIGAGAGVLWADTEKVRFTTDASATYTFQEDVVSNPFTKHNFPGVRVAYDLWTQVSTTTEFTSTLFFDVNLDNTDDLRADWTNALPISISETLFFKPALRILWRNDPSLESIPLEGSDPVINVLAPLDEIDTFASVSLVVKI